VVIRVLEVFEGGRDGEMIVNEYRGAVEWEE
jgi:hypothetical protein